MLNNQPQKVKIEEMVENLEIYHYHKLVVMDRIELSLSAYETLVLTVRRHHRKLAETVGFEPTIHLRGNILAGCRF